MVYATAEPDRALIGQRSDAIMANLRASQDGEEEAKLKYSVPGLLDNPDAPFSGAGLFGLSPQQSLEALTAQVRQFARDTPQRVGYVPLSYLQRDVSTGPALLEHLIQATAALPRVDSSAAANGSGSWARVGPPGGSPASPTAMRTDDFMQHLQRSPGGGSSSPGGANSRAAAQACHIVSAADWTVLITPQDVVTVGLDGKVCSSFPLALIKAKGGDVQLLPVASPASPPASQAAPAVGAPANETTENEETSAQEVSGDAAAGVTVPPRPPPPSPGRARLQLRIKSISTLPSPRAGQTQPAAVLSPSPQKELTSNTAQSTASAPPGSPVLAVGGGTTTLRLRDDIAPDPRGVGAAATQPATQSTRAAVHGQTKMQQTYTPPQAAVQGGPGRAAPRPPNAAAGISLKLQPAQGQKHHAIKPRSTSPAVVDVRPTSFSPTGQNEPRPGAVAAAVAVSGQQQHLSHMHRERVLTAWTMESLQQQVQQAAVPSSPSATTMAAPSPRLAVSRRLQVPAASPSRGSSRASPQATHAEESLDEMEQFLSGVRSRLTS